MDRFKAFVTLVVLLLAYPVGASADLLIDGSVGIKGSLAGSLWVEPEKGATVTSTTGQAIVSNFLYFDNTQFDLGGGVGLYGEVRLLKVIGLEIDLFYEKNGFLEEHEWNSIYETERSVTYETFRIPVLLKGILPLGLASLSLGVGPEFVIGLSAEAKSKPLSTDVLGTDAVATQETAHMDAKSVNATYLDMDLGITFHVWKLSIPFNLRVGYNLSQEPDWDERVDLEYSSQTIYTMKVHAMSTWDFRAMLGLAYNF